MISIFRCIKIWSPCLIIFSLHQHQNIFITYQQRAVPEGCTFMLYASHLKPRDSELSYQWHGWCLLWIKKLQVFCYFLKLGSITVDCCLQKPFCVSFFNFILNWWWLMIIFAPSHYEVFFSIKCKNLLNLLGWFRFCWVGS